MTGAPTDSVKPGDTVSYTIESGEGEFDDWDISLYDTLWDEIENLAGPGDREIKLVNGKATVTYKRFFLNFGYN